MRMIKLIIAMLMLVNATACAAATTNCAVRIVDDAGLRIKDVQVHATFHGVKVLDYHQRDDKTDKKDQAHVSGLL